MGQQRFTFDIDKIVSYLKQYNNDLSNLYKWDVKIEKLEDLNNLLTKNLIDVNHRKDKFELNINLREIISEELNQYHNLDKKKFNELCLWIVKDWGGIKGAKDEDTLKSVNTFLKKDYSFDRIASTSKVASFMYPEKYAIYDARAVYTLNWIILSEKASGHFFPMPQGRNSKMNAFDMNVLIRLNSIDLYNMDSSDKNNRKHISNIDKNIFIPKNEAYNEFNLLIKKITESLWDNSKSIYHTEMLLFSIADKEIFMDILNKVKFDMKQNKI